MDNNSTDRIIKKYENQSYWITNRKSIAGFVLGVATLVGGLVGYSIKNGDIEDIRRNELNDITALFNKNKAELKDENETLRLENKSIDAFKKQLEICEEKSEEAKYQLSSLKDSIKIVQEYRFN